MLKVKVFLNFLKSAQYYILQTWQVLSEERDHYMRAISTRQFHSGTQILKQKTVGSDVIIRSVERIFQVEFSRLSLPNVSHSTKQSDSSEMLS
jgi:hypothetical protein